MFRSGVARLPADGRRAPRELDDVLAGTAADLQHVAGLVREEGAEHRPDRLVVAMEGRCIEPAFLIGCFVMIAWVITALLGDRITPYDPFNDFSLGHEPPNPFATSIAKYFKNATREAILLQVCNAGIVFLPGAAGTVQEVFQDACENYYADPASIAPMVLVGREHWTRTVPAWPLLHSLARDLAVSASGGAGR